LERRRWGKRDGGEGRTKKWSRKILFIVLFVFGFFLIVLFVIIVTIFLVIIVALGRNNTILYSRHVPFSLNLVTVAITITVAI